MKKEEIDFLQRHVSDGGFLQSEDWRRFQEKSGRKTYHFSQGGFWGNVVEHTLPVIGNYWYIPRGPVMEEDPREALSSLVREAKKHQVSWIRIEPNTESALAMIRNAGICRVEKAPHDMQPREILLLSIENDEDALLANMKSKTRYNIRLAQKKGVRVFMTNEKKYRDIFCDLVAVTALRDGIVSHPRVYYERMMETLPDCIKLYVAEYEGKVLAANLVAFFGEVATYLHGASSNDFRQLMAPYLLQWRQIQDARQAGCKRYDFGGVKMGAGSSESEGVHSWAGITRFKHGFAPNVQPIVFPGSYDMVIDEYRYAWYRRLQRIKQWLRR